MEQEETQQPTPAQPPPDAATPAPTTAPAAPAAAPAQPADPPQVQHLPEGENDQISLEQAKADSWGTKVYHGILNALGGANDVSLARDPQTGRMVATAVKSGPGQQWKRIISGAITGYGAAMAGGGTGPGSTARGAGLGIQAGQQQAQKTQQQQRDNANEDFEMQQKAATSNAQNALLSHQIAESTFRLGRSQIEAAVADTERETNFTKMIAEGGEGSTDMGVFPDFPAVLKAFKEMPQLHDHQANGQLVTIPHVDGNGKIDGVHVAMVTPGWLAAKTTKDIPITVNSIKDGKLQEETFTIPAGSITNDQASKLMMGQSKDQTEEWHKRQTEEREASRTKAQNTEDYAQARKADAEAKKANADAAWDDANEAAAAGTNGGASLVDMIGTGKMPVGRMAYLMARKPELLQAVAQKYPDFDANKVDSYGKVYKEFTSGKVADQLNSGDAALRHMNELKALNTSASHNPASPAYTAYVNKAHTVAVELAKFYGNPTIPAIQKIEDTLLSQLPGKRDAAIFTQAKSMSDKFDEFKQQWINAAPSAAYEAQMPQMSAAALAARENLDPEFKAQRVEEERLGTILRPSGAQQPALPPQAMTAVTNAKGQPVTFGNGQTWQLVNGRAVQIQPQGAR